MELVGATDGHVCVLTASSMHRLMESSNNAANLVRTIAAVALDELPTVHRSRLTDPQLRTLSAVCTLRSVGKGQAVFHAGELGHAFAIVVRGVLAPAAHGAIAAAIGLAQAHQHWKAVHDVTSLLSKSPLSALKAKAATTASPPAIGAIADGSTAAVDASASAANGAAQPRTPPKVQVHDPNHGRPTPTSHPGSHPRDPMEPGAMKLNQLGPGTPVGVAAMLVGDKGAHVAWLEHDDVVAAEPSLVAVINRGADLNAFLGIIPPFEQLLQRVAKARLLRTYGAALLGAQAASAQAQRKIVSIADRCRLLQAKAQQVITTSGEEVHSLHIVVAGTVRAQRKAVAHTAGGAHHASPNEEHAKPSTNGGTPAVSASPSDGGGEVGAAGANGSSTQMGGAVRAGEVTVVEDTQTIAPGEAFGEGALLMRGTVCDATYRAGASGATLLQVPRHSFFELLGKDRTLLAALHIKLLRHEASLAAILAHPRARAAFAGFVERVCSDHHSLEAYAALPALPLPRHPPALVPTPPRRAHSSLGVDGRYEAMHAYAQLAPSGLAAAARTVGHAIHTEFIRHPAPRPIRLTDGTRRAVQHRTPARDAVDHWPSTLFAEAQAELERLLAGSFLPGFMAHAVFPHVLAMLGGYDAERLFPPGKVDEAKRDLIKAIHGDMSASTLDMSA